MTGLQKILVPVAAAALLALPVVVWAQQQEAPVTPSNVSAPVTGEMSKSQLKQQKKMQKAEEKSAKDNAKSAKDQSKALQYQDKATDAAEKSRAEQPSTTTPQ